MSEVTRILGAIQRGCPKAAEELLPLVYDEPRKSAAFFSDSQGVLTGGEDDTAKLWDARTGRELLSLSHAYPVNAVAVSSDGQRLFAICDNGTATIWPARDWKTSTKRAAQ